MFVKSLLIFAPKNTKILNVLLQWHVYQFVQTRPASCRAWTFLFPAVARLVALNDHTARSHQPPGPI